jgi:glycosyltransferase involved in cell wall biosynthesis
LKLGVPWFPAQAETPPTQTTAVEPPQTGPIDEPAADPVLAEVQAASIVNEHERLFCEAATPSGGRDVIWLGIIEWSYRIQRPQHLAMQLANRGSRVFYVSIVFGARSSAGRCTILGSPHPRVYEVRLLVDNDVPDLIYQGFTAAQTMELQLSLDEMCLVFGLRAPIVVVEYPSWYRIAISVPLALVVYDCLDDLAGFSNVIPPTMLELEAVLVEAAHLVITPTVLPERLRNIRPAVRIDNGGDVKFFARLPDDRDSKANPDRVRRPRIGYFGAISTWFEVDWIVHSALRHPDWDFMLIGEVSQNEFQHVEERINITLCGEKPYDELPDYLATFDVAVIPFKLTPLTIIVNPVKLYEYMAQGKPVVCSALPEVMKATDLVYIARDAYGFDAQIQKALAENSEDLRRRRVDWAARNTWEKRADDFVRAVEATTQKRSL